MIPLQAQGRVAGKAALVTGTDLMIDGGYTA
jgi:hypothetical protein